MLASRTRSFLQKVQNQVATHFHVVEHESKQLLMALVNIIKSPSARQQNVFKLRFSQLFSGMRLRNTFHFDIYENLWGKLTTKIDNVDKKKRNKFLIAISIFRLKRPPKLKITRKKISKEIRQGIDIFGVLEMLGAKNLKK